MCPMIPSRSLAPSRLPVKRKALIRPRRAEVLTPPHLGQPLDRPQWLISFAVCSDTGLPVDGPDLRLSVHGAAEEVLARVVPVNRSDPRRVAGEVSDVFAVLHVVHGDDGSVA